MSNAGFWDDFNKGGSKKSSGGKIVNLKLEVRDDPYQFRLVGEPQEFTKLFYNNKSVVLNPNSPLIDRYSGGKAPSSKFACLVIDREDQILKVIEIPANPLKALVTWRKLKKRVDPDANPGGDNGCDWGIEVTNATGKPKDKRYNGIALHDSPLTEAEKKLIEEANIQLDKLYRALPDEEAEARLLGNAPPAKAQQPQQQQAPRPAVGATTTVTKDIPF